MMLVTWRFAVSLSASAIFSRMAYALEMRLTLLSLRAWKDEMVSSGLGMAGLGRETARREVNVVRKVVSRVVLGIVLVRDSLEEL